MAHITFSLAAPNMNTEPEFAEEHTQEERIRFFVIGILIGAVVIISSKTWLFPWFGEFVKSAPCRTIFGIEGLTVLWYSMFVGIPLHILVLFGAPVTWRGCKVLRDGQFPPTKEKVYRSTKIQRGAKAKLIGYLHLSVFLALLAFTIWGYFQAAEMSRTRRPKVETCSADKVVDHKLQMKAIPSSQD